MRKKFKTKLHEILSIHNVSISLLSASTGIPKNHLYSYINGIRIPNLENSIRITTALPFVSIKYIAGDKKLKKIENDIKKRLLLIASEARYVKLENEQENY